MAGSNDYNNKIDNAQSIIDNYKIKSLRVRDGCNYDMSKCFADGKPLIICGDYIDPQLYVDCLKS